MTDKSKNQIPRYDVRSLWDEPQVQALPIEIKLGLTLLLQDEYLRGLDDSQGAVRSALEQVTAGHDHHWLGCGCGETATRMLAQLGIKPSRPIRMRKCGSCGIADIPFGVGWPYWKSGEPVHAVCPDPATKPTVLIALNEQVADSWREDYPDVEVKVVPELPRSS